MMDEEAGPSAQAFTSWAKSVTVVAVHLEIDLHGRAAGEAGGGRSGFIGLCRRGANTPGQLDATTLRFHISNV